MTTKTKTKGKKFKSIDDNDIDFDHHTNDLECVKSTHNPTHNPTHNSTHCSNKEYTAYLIINDDLKMSKGKIASQSAHAILDVHRFMLSNGMENKAWTNHGEKIVVLRASEVIIRQLVAEYGEPIINKKKDKLNVFPIYDAGRTEVDPGSLTVLATTPITDSSKPDILRILKLL
jgi:PTH2 family peptidyl-tRNA hydrolase